jgi:mono/diheme cytochrome c family protein
MHDLEWLAYYIDPPRWPTAVFGEIKPNLAAAGERVFRNQCAGCHEYGDDRRTSTGLLRLRGMRPEDVGTDPTATLRISCPVSDTGALV